MDHKEEVKEDPLHPARNVEMFGDTTKDTRRREQEQYIVGHGENGETEYPKEQENQFKMKRGRRAAQEEHQHQQDQGKQSVPPSTSISSRDVKNSSLEDLLHYDDNIGSTRRYFLDDAAGGRDRYDEKQEKGEEEKSSSYSYYKKKEEANPLPSLFPSSSNMKNDIDTLLAKHYLNSYMPATSHTSSSSAPDTSSGDATTSSRSFYFATRNKISRKTKPPSRSPLSPLECIQRGERGPSVDKRLASLSNEDDTITEAGITTGATTSRTQRHPSKPRIIADFIPEVHFVGEIKSGHGFNAGYSSLTCKWSVDWGTTWSLLEGSQEGQTQFAAATAATTTNSNCHSSTSSCVWNHPIDLHFTTANMKGWPRIILQVWSLDSYGTASIIGYGFTYFPATPGMQELEVKCWRPRGTLSEEISHFFLGSSIRLTQERLILDDAWEKRHNLVTILTGKVTIEISCIMRYFDNQYVCTHAPG